MKKHIVSVFRFALILAMLLAIPQTISAQTPPRNPGYTPPANFSELPVRRFSPSAGSGSDSQRLTDLINEVTALRTTGSSGNTIRGGRIVIASGRYRMRNILMQSNVHLRFGRNVTIDFDTEEIRGFRGVSILRLVGGVSNVSIVGNSPSRRLKLLGPPTPTDPLREERSRLITVRGVTNFLLRNIDIDNRESRFVSIFMASDGETFVENVDGRRPFRGEVSNISAINNTGGFGTIQIHTGGRISFQNISSEGGVALRLETGIATVNGLTDIDANNIRVENGRSAVLLQPHAVRSHNRIRIRNVSALESGFGVEVLNGFVSRRDRALGRPEFTSPGQFRNVSIRNVTVNRGTTAGAQIRPGTLNLVPGSATPIVRSRRDFRENFRRNGDTLTARPLGVVRNEAISYMVTIDSSSLDAGNLPPRTRTPLIITRDTPSRNSNFDRAEDRYRVLAREIEADKAALDAS